IVLSSTVFPQPLSPMIATVCPRGTASEISRSTKCRPKLTSSSYSSIRPLAGGSFLDCFVDISRMAAPSPRHQVRPNDVVNLIQSNAQKEIEDENNYERQHKRGRRRPADSLGPGRAIEPAVATHDCNRRAKEDAFEDAIEQIPVMHELL